MFGREERAAREEGGLQLVRATLARAGWMPGGTTKIVGIFQPFHFSPSPSFALSWSGPFSERSSDTPLPRGLAAFFLFIRVCVPLGLSPLGGKIAGLGHFLTGTFWDSGSEVTTAGRCDPGTLDERTHPTLSFVSFSRRGERKVKGREKKTKPRFTSR